MAREILIPRPNPKQAEVLRDRSHKYLAYGGARGGGKSWVVRVKAVLMCATYPGIRILIVRKTYKELQNNHIDCLNSMLYGVVKYNKTDKIMYWPNGSSVSFGYCDTDADVMQYQGVEYDVIFIDEATNLTEYQMEIFKACVRGVNEFPKRIYYTCNPGGPGHQYIKRLFIDRVYRPQERPEDYVFYQALPRDNTALMEAQPDYISQLEALPRKLRAAWLEGRWDVFEGQFFEDFIINPDPEKCRAAGITADEMRSRRRWCHVINPLESVPQGWPIYRSFDWGYSRPFSCGYWTVDYDGRLYRIAEYYGSDGEPNEGVKWDADRVFAELRRYEADHPLLRGRQIGGVADPAIWDASRGPSIADMGIKYGILFTPGDHKRISGWQQVHYRFAFDRDGYPMMYICSNCKQFIRTFPLLQYDPTHAEDLDTDGEDHIADEVRYMCMARPIQPPVPEAAPPVIFDPLNQYRGAI